jgi:dihydropyrimidine dehydrogenase (NAD+) subunit PreA
MVDLHTTYMGISIKNPLIVGAGPTTHTPEICQKAAQAGWAAVVLKTNIANDVMQVTDLEHKMPRPEFKLLDARGVNPWRPIVPKLRGTRRRGGKILGKVQPDYTLIKGSQYEVFPHHKMITGIGQLFNGDEKYLWYINKTKELLAGTDCKVIASVVAYAERGWEQQCNLINKSDADMIELNFGCWAIGCPHPETGEVVRQGIGTFPELVEKITRLCVERIKVPVGVKLAPHCPDPIASMQAAIGAGAKAIQYADAVPYLAPVHALHIDPETLEVGYFPGLPFPGTICYPWVLPYMCGVIARARIDGITRDISGCGGVRDYLDVIRLIMAGASSVQVCTATIVEGVGIGSEYLEALRAWMEQHGYNNIRDIQGIVAREDKIEVNPSRFQPAVIPQIAGGPEPEIQVVVNKKRCINCGWCEGACPYLAINVEDGVPVFDSKKCEVCGLCVELCPMRALSLVPREQ